MSRPTTLILTAIAFTVTIAPVTAADSGSPADAALPAYATVNGLNGTLTAIGSDTLDILMTGWKDRFSTLYSNVNMQGTYKGSNTAPPALVEGTAQLGPMSREMKKEEEDAFVAKFGYKPTKIAVAIDALAIFVHKDNPLTSLTMREADGIFSSTFKAGGSDISDWGKLAQTAAWAGSPISVYTRDSGSGTYVYFKEHVLMKGDFKPSAKQQPGSAGVVQAVASDKFAIGFSGIGYVNSGVKVLTLDNGKGPVAGTLDNCLNRSYPLARLLYVYVNKAPGKPLDPLAKEYLTFALSKEGQTVVGGNGYYPLSATLAAIQRKLLD